MQTHRAAESELDEAARFYPENVAIVLHRAKKHGPFHKENTTAERPDPPAAPWYRVDLAPSDVQRYRVQAAIDELYMLKSSPDSLYGTNLAPLTYVLAFRKVDQYAKQAINSVANLALAGAHLRRRAGETLGRDIPDPNGFGEPIGDACALGPFSDDEVVKCPGSVFQIPHPVPSRAYAEQVAARHGLNDGHQKALHSTRHHPISVVLGPPGCGKTTLGSAVIDTWLMACPPGHYVGMFAGSNTACDQSCRSVAQRAQAGQLVSDTLFPKSCVRLARDDAVDDDIKAHTPAGHYQTSFGQSSALISGKAFNRFKNQLVSNARLIVATHEASTDIGKLSSCLIGILDESAQSNDLMASMPMAQIVRARGHSLFIGDPHQLEPTVMSKIASSLGIGISIFSRVHDSLGEQEGAVINLTSCYRCHPDILAWPSYCFYDSALVSALQQPNIDRPLADGIPWTRWEPLSIEKVRALASINKTDEAGVKDLHRVLSQIAGRPTASAQQQLDSGTDYRRVIMIDVPSQEVGNHLHEGASNIREAATCIDLCYALMPYCLAKSKTIRIVTGYRSMLPFLQDGYPLTRDQFSRSMGKGKSKGKAKGKVADQGKGKSAGSVQRKGGQPLLVQDPSDANGGFLAFEGVRQRCAALWDAGLLRVDTIDSTQGGEADIVIFNTTRSNPQHSWGFMDSAKGSTWRSPGPWTR